MNARAPVSLLLAAALAALAGPAAADKASEDAAAELLEKRMLEQRPQDLVILRSVKGKEVVVVQGGMDHIEEVLATSKIPYTLITPDQVAGADLRADQIVMVNCPGYMPDDGVKRLERFVRAGGLLYTTDWALKNVVEKAFPGTVGHNGHSTGDHVTPVQVVTKHEDLMSNLLLTRNTQPQWWLEGGSYPIKILDRQKVEILAVSAQMEKSYGAGPVVVRFRWHDGEVIHVVSHFYRQVATQGPAVAAASKVNEIEGLSTEAKKDFAKGAGGAVNMGDVESSYAFQQMTSNLVVGKAKRNETLDKEYAFTPKAAAVVEGREVKRGEKLKVLERAGDRVRVRDDRGNEGYMFSDEVVAR